MKQTYFRMCTLITLSALVSLLGMNWYLPLEAQEERQTRLVASFADVAPGNILWASDSQRLVIENSYSSSIMNWYEYDVSSQTVTTSDNYPLLYSLDVAERQMLESRKIGEDLKKAPVFFRQTNAILPRACYELGGCDATLSAWTENRIPVTSVMVNGRSLPLIWR